MRVRKILPLAALALLSASAAFSQAVDPGTPVGGVSQKEWAAEWYRWYMTRGTTNPVTETDGSRSHLGDVSPDVFFFAGIASDVTGTSVANRVATVPAGKHLFFPIINSIADNTNSPGLPPTTFTASELLTGAFGVNYVRSFDSVRGVSVVLDGTSLLNPTAGRQTWGLTDPGFSITYPSADNFWSLVGFDASLNTGVYPSTVTPTVGDGYWMMLEPLAAGHHSLHFTGTVPFFDAAGEPLLNGNGEQFSFSQDITYRFTVTAAPEPGTAALLGLGAAALGLRLRRRAEGKRGH